MARELGWPDAPEALPRPVIDSHTHLDVHDRSLHGDQAPDADALLAWAEQVGVPKVVQIGCDVESAEWSVPFAGTPECRWGWRCIPTTPLVSVFAKGETPWKQPGPASTSWRGTLVVRGR